MGKRREEVEAVLLEQARQAIGKLLDEFGDASTMRLSEMEKAVGEMGQSLMEASLQHWWSWSTRCRRRSGVRGAASGCIVGGNGSGGW